MSAEVNQDTILIVRMKLHHHLCVLVPKYIDIHLAAPILYILPSLDATNISPTDFKFIPLFVL